MTTRDETRIFEKIARGFAGQLKIISGILGGRSIERPPRSLYNFNLKLYRPRLITTGLCFKSRTREPVALSFSYSTSVKPKHLPHKLQI